ncbi:MAG: response regulator transcription factor, partial [Candidatus Puniceispirillaceae bacterium]
VTHSNRQVPHSARKAGRNQSLAMQPLCDAGFLPYHMSSDALLGALRVLAAGERYLPADMVVRRGVPAGDIILTLREHDVLSGLRSGLSNKEIADNLSLSEVTVKHHIKSLRGKLGARNRVHAVCRANELDIR